MIKYLFAVLLSFCVVLGAIPKLITPSELPEFQKLRGESPETWCKLFVENKIQESMFLELFRTVLEAEKSPEKRFGIYLDFQKKILRNVPSGLYFRFANVPFFNTVFSESAKRNPNDAFFAVMDMIVEQQWSDNDNRVFPVDQFRSPKLLLKIGDTFLQKNRFETAGKIFRKAYSLAPSAKTALALAVYENKCARPEKALEIIRTQLKKENSAEDSLYLAEALIILEQPEEALAVLNRIPADRKHYGRDFLKVCVLHILGRKTEMMPILLKIPAIPLKDINSRITIRQAGWKTEKQRKLISFVMTRFHMESPSMNPDMVRTIISSLSMKRYVPHSYMADKLPEGAWISLFQILLNEYKNANADIKKCIRSAFVSNGYPDPELVVNPAFLLTRSRQLRKKFIDGTITRNELDDFDFIVAVQRTAGCSAEENMLIVKRLIQHRSDEALPILQNWISLPGVGKDEILEVLKDAKKTFNGPDDLPPHFYSYKADPAVRKFIADWWKETYETRKTLFDDVYAFNSYIKLRIHLMAPAEYTEILNTIASRKNSMSLFFGYPGLNSVSGNGWSQSSAVVMFQYFFQNSSPEQRLPARITDTPALESVRFDLLSRCGQGMPLTQSTLSSRDKVDRNQLWESVRESRLSDSAKAWFACRFNRKTDAAAYLKRALESQKTAESQAFLEWGAMALYIGEPELSDRLFSTVLHSEKASMHHREIAAFFLLNRNKEFDRASSLILSCEPNQRDIFYNFLRNKGVQTSRIDALRRKYPVRQSAKENLDTFFQNFAERMKKDREKAIACLNEYLDERWPASLDNAGWVWNKCRNGFRSWNRKNIDAMYKYLNTLKSDPKADPFRIALLYDAVLDDSRASYFWYRKAFEQNPKNRYFAIKTYEKGALAEDPKKMIPLFEALYTNDLRNFRSCFRGKDPRPLLLTTEFVLNKIGGNPIPELIFRLLENALSSSFFGDSEKGIPGLPGLSYDSFCDNFDKKVSARRMKLYFALLDKGMKVPGLRRNAGKKYLSQLFRDRNTPLPEEFDLFVRETYPPFKHEANLYDFYIFCDSMKNGTGRWSLFAEKNAPQLKDRFEYWEKLRTAPAEKFPELIRSQPERIADSGMGDFELMLKAAEIRGFQLDVCRFLELSGSFKDGKFPLKSLFSYLETTASAENTRKFFMDFNEKMAKIFNGKEPGFLGPAEEPNLTLYYSVRGWLQNSIQRSDKIRNALMLACFGVRTDTPFYFSNSFYSRVKEPGDLFTLLKDTPLFADMKGVHFRRSAENMDIYSTGLLRSLEPMLLLKTDRTFGMDLMLYAIKQRRNSGEIDNMLLRRKDEWLALTPEERVGVLQNILRVNWGNIPEQMPLLEPSYSEAKAKLEEKELKELFMKTEIAKNNPYPEIQTAFRLFRSAAEKKSPDMVKIFRKIRSLSAWNPEHLEGQLRSKTLPFEAYCVIYDCGYRFSQPPYSFHAILVNNLLQVKSDEFFKRIMKFRTIFPNCIMPEKICYVILKYKDRSGDARLAERFAAASKKEPSDAMLKLAAAMFRARTLQNEKKPFPEAFRAELIRQLKEAQKSQDRFLRPAEIEKAFPECFGKGSK